MTRRVAEELSQVNPALSRKLADNAELYAARLDSLRSSFENVLSKATNRKIITQHAAFDYFAREFELEIVGVIATESGVQPSAREIADLIDTVRLTDPVGIFVEPQYSDQIARTLSAETGIPLYSLDPAVTGDEDPDSYLRIMQQNLETLKEAFGVDDASAAAHQ
jgi:zinc transport system substrate-binding protein